MAAKSKELENFDRTMDDLLKVSPAQIEADLDAEKKAKAERKANNSAPSRKIKNPD
jgi:hypothetical protein